MRIDRANGYSVADGYSKFLFIHPNNEGKTSQTEKPDARVRVFTHHFSNHFQQIFQEREIFFIQFIIPG